MVELTYEKALEKLNNIINSNYPLNVIKSILQNLSNIFYKEDRNIGNKYNEVLAFVYNNQDTEKIKNKIRSFLVLCDEIKGKLEIKKYDAEVSSKFINKFLNLDPNNIKKFQEITRKIHKSDINYGTETVGQFLVSPRGHRDERVVWYKEGDTHHFCDLFGHDKEYKEFLKLARKRKIKRNDYTDWCPSEKFAPLNL